MAPKTIRRSKPERQDLAILAGEMGDREVARIAKCSIHTVRNWRQEFCVAAYSQSVAVECSDVVSDVVQSAIQNNSLDGFIGPTDIQLAFNANITHEDLRKLGNICLADDRMLAHRVMCAIAKHTNTTEDILTDMAYAALHTAYSDMTYYASDRHVDITDMVAAFSTDSNQDEADRSRHPMIEKFWLECLILSHPNCHATTAEMFAKSTIPALRALSLCNRNLSDLCVTVLSRDLNDAVRELAISDDRMDENRLEHALFDPAQSVALVAAQHPVLLDYLPTMRRKNPYAVLQYESLVARFTTDPHALRELAQTTELWETEAEIAKNIYTPIDILDSFTLDRSEEVRAAVASNPAATDEILWNLYRSAYSDRNNALIVAIARNPTTKTDLLDAINHNNSSDELDIALAEHPNASHDVLWAVYYGLGTFPDNVLADHAMRIEISKRLLHHPNTPEEIKAELYDSPYRAVLDEIVEPW